MIRKRKEHWLFGSPLSEEPGIPEDVDTLEKGSVGNRQEVTRPYG